jgi:hypothetical protein
MAFFPCDRGPHRNTAVNRNWYFAIGSGISFDRYMIRLCDRHSADVQEDLAQFELLTAEDTPGISDGEGLCLACHKPVGQVGLQAFITGYVAKDERKDYWGQVHSACTVPPSMAPPARLNNRPPAFA